MDIDAGGLFGASIQSVQQGAVHNGRACHSAMAAPTACVTWRELVQSEERLRDGLQLCMQLLVCPTEHLARVTLKR